MHLLPIVFLVSLSLALAATPLKPTPCLTEQNVMCKTSGLQRVCNPCDPTGFLVCQDGAVGSTLQCDTGDVFNPSEGICMAPGNFVLCDGTVAGSSKPTPKPASTTADGRTSTVPQMLQSTAKAVAADIALAHGYRLKETEVQNLVKKMESALKGVTDDVLWADPESEESASVGSLAAGSEPSFTEQLTALASKAMEQLFGISNTAEQAPQPISFAGAMEQGLDTAEEGSLDSLDVVRGPRYALGVQTLDPLGQPLSASVVEKEDSEVEVVRGPRVDAPRATAASSTAQPARRPCRKSMQPVEAHAAADRSSEPNDFYAPYEPFDQDTMSVSQDINYDDGAPEEQHGRRMALLKFAAEALQGLQGSLEELAGVLGGQMTPQQRRQQPQPLRLPRKVVLHPLPQLPLKQLTQQRQPEQTQQQLQDQQEEQQIQPADSFWELAERTMVKETEKEKEDRKRALEWLASLHASRRERADRELRLQQREGAAVAQS